MKIPFLSSTKEALQQFLKNKKLSADERARLGAFNREASGQSAGHAISRFYRKPSKDVLAAFKTSLNLTAFVSVAEFSRQAAETARAFIEQAIDMARTPVIPAVLTPQLALTFAGSVGVPESVFKVLEGNRLAFETAVARIEAGISPDAIGPHTAIFHAYSNAPKTHNLSVLFNPDGKRSYIYCAETVEELTNAFTKNAQISPARNAEPSIRIMTFSRGEPTAVSFGRATSAISHPINSIPDTHVVGHNPAANDTRAPVPLAA